MSAKLNVVRSLVPVFCVLLSGALLLGPRRAVAQPGSPPDLLTAPQAQAFVARALANELRAARDTSHPMRYVLRKATPRFSSARLIFETGDGDVARLIAVNGQPLSPAAEQAEQARLDDLDRDPERQQHRKRAEEADTQRALDVLRMLPSAFLYTYAGPAQTPAGRVQKFTFRPNPAFDPPDMETEVLTAMEGEICIDAAQQRVTRLDGRLVHDVDFGWGILGRLYSGGWIAIEQANVGAGQWRMVRLQLDMRGRVVFRARSFNLVEQVSRFAPLPPGMGYREAIAQIKAER